MADASKSLDIKIRTASELQGAQEAAQSLEKQVIKAKALKEEYAGLEAALQKVRKAMAEYKTEADAAASVLREEEIAQQELAKSTSRYSKQDLEELFGKTEKVTKGKEALKGVIGKLSQQIPAVGLLLRGALGGASVIVAVTTMAVGYLVEKFNQLKDTIRKVGENASQIRSDWIDKQKEAADAAAVSLNQFYNDLRRVDAFTTQETRRGAERLNRIEREAAAQEKLRAAYKRYEEASVQAALKSGKITEQQAIKLKLEIDSRYFEAQLRAEEEKAHRILRSLVLERDSINFNKQQLGNTVNAAQARFQEAEKRKIKFDDQLAQDKANLKTEDEKLKQMQQQQSDLSYIPWWRKTGAEKETQKFLENTIPGQADVVNALRRAIKDAEKRRPEVYGEFESTKANLDASKSDLQDATNRADELDREYRKRRSDFQFQQGLNDQLEPVEQRARDLNADAELGEENKKEADRILQNRGRPRNRGQQQSSAAVDTSGAQAALKNLEEQMTAFTVAVEQSIGAAADQLAKTNARIQDSFNA